MAIENSQHIMNEGWKISVYPIIHFQFSEDSGKEGHTWFTFFYICMHFHILYREYMLLLNSGWVSFEKQSPGSGPISYLLKFLSMLMHQKRALLSLSKGVIAQSPGKSGTFSQVQIWFFCWLWFFFCCCSFFFSASENLIRVPSDPVGTSSNHSINKHSAHDLYLVHLCRASSVTQEYPFTERGVKYSINLAIERLKTATCTVLT